MVMAIETRDNPDEPGDATLAVAIMPPGIDAAGAGQRVGQRARDCMQESGRTAGHMGEDEEATAP